MSPFGLVDVTKDESPIQVRFVGKIIEAPAAFLPESVNIPTKGGFATFEGFAVSPDCFGQGRNGVCPIPLVLPLRKSKRARCVPTFKQPGIIRPKDMQIDFGLDSGQSRYTLLYRLN